MVQVAVFWKPTNNILFRFVGNDRVDIYNIPSHQSDVQHTWEENQNLAGKYIHKFQFLMAPTDNYIRVEELPFGLHNVDIKGFGATFGQSSGMVGEWGLWDENTRVKLRNEKLYDGFDATKVAKSWRVLPNESILSSPSDVCAADAPCGPGRAVQCVEDLNTFRKNRGERNEDSCESTCDDIEDATARLFCAEAERLTGFSFWGCTNAFINPITVESQCPLDCVGDATRGPFFIESIGDQKDCLWAVWDPAKKAKRCSIPEVAINCCESCCASCEGDAAGTDRFLIPELNKKKTCKWVERNDPVLRCSLQSVLRMCCETCAKAIPSLAPSIHPSLSVPPSVLPTGVISASPSLMFSTHPSLFLSHEPSAFPTKSPTLSPSFRPTKQPSRSPSHAPSVVPSSLPSLIHSQHPSDSPSASPSLNPSNYPICEASELLGKTLYVYFASVC